MAREHRLPTVTTQDARNSGMGVDGVTLSDAVLRGRTAIRIPTPRASDATKGSASRPVRPGGEGMTLPEAVMSGRLPTPMVANRKLHDAARLPTPVARDHKGSGMHNQLPTTIAEMYSLPDSPSCAPSAPSDGDGTLRLNPRFVEWMMGWPQGWTETLPPASMPSTSRTASTRSATASSTSPQLSLGLSSGPVSTTEDL